MNKQGPHPKRKLKKGVLARTIKMLFEAYPVLLPVTVGCILFSAVVSAIPAVFTQNILALIEKWYVSRDWAGASAEIIPKVLILLGLYVVSIISITTYTQLMAYITQGFLCKLRCKMFDCMQNLPVKYFDTNKHGDIMSHYTNDIDTLRQLISQSLPHFLQSISIVSCVLVIMVYYSVPMTLVVLIGVMVIFAITKKVGGGSAKYFMKQQKSMGETEGYVQEIMNGQKVVKVFCHEDECNRDFEELNNQLFEDSYKAHAYANSIGPINMNVGNILYVTVATMGGLFIVSGMNNLSLSGLAFSISLVVPFLNMTK